MAMNKEKRNLVLLYICGTAWIIASILSLRHGAKSSKFMEIEAAIFIMIAGTIYYKRNAK
jgi:hypothetical protein